MIHDPDKCFTIGDACACLQGSIRTPALTGSGGEGECVAPSLLHTPATLSSTCDRRIRTQLQPHVPLTSQSRVLQEHCPGYPRAQSSLDPAADLSWRLTCSFSHCAFSWAVCSVCSCLTRGEGGQLSVAEIRFACFYCNLAS